MPDPSLGIVLVLITALGYISNWLNWRYLNYRFMHALYYIGAFVHEMSHAVLCIVTGATIEEIVIFSEIPHVTHRKSRLPIFGEPLIAFAPIVGGMLFLFFVNRFVLHNYFIVPQFASIVHWQNFFDEALQFLMQLHPFAWQSWVMTLLFWNAGAMIGPSFQDLKNIWPVLLVLFFVSAPPLVDWASVALGLIFVNIILQVALIGILRLADFFPH